MTNTTNPQKFCKRIEHLVEEYISATRAAARAAVDRAFATAATPSAKPSRPRTTTTPARSRGGARRAADEIGTLSERVYEAVCRMPGEMMTVIAPTVGATARELNRPMLRLKQAGRVRSVGTRHATRLDTSRWRARSRGLRLRRRRRRRARTATEASRCPRVHGSRRSGVRARSCSACAPCGPRRQAPSRLRSCTPARFRDLAIELGASIGGPGGLGLAAEIVNGLLEGADPRHRRPARREQLGRQRLLGEDASSRYPGIVRRDDEAVPRKDKGRNEQGGGVHGPGRSNGHAHETVRTNVIQTPNG